ncbi:MAG: GH25 family lysozyme [Chloroflexota bacterium]|nr:GH25 family lysozyme [Chloroflexota bacterium]
MGETNLVALRRRALPLLVAVLASLALAAALPAGQAATAADSDLAGIDVSHYQGEIGWSDVVGDGVGFAIAKATEGRLYQDDQYARNKDRAEALGLPFTAYHFASPDSTANDAVLEADNFVDTANLGPGDLRPVLDLEKSGGLGVKKLRNWVKAWLAEVEGRVGAKPIIYTSPSFWHDKMGNSRWFANNAYALWIAHWHVAQPRVPAGNWAGHGWTIWQYDNCGSMAGIDGCVDLDRLNGTDIDALRIPPSG